MKLPDCILECPIIDSQTYGNSYKDIQWVHLERV